MGKYVERAVVSPEEAKQQPYPYVYVNANRPVRELHDAERQYLEQPFSPFDGGRPYIKHSFESLDGWASIAGFCRRSLIPRECQLPLRRPKTPIPR